MKLLRRARGTLPRPALQPVSSGVRRDLARFFATSVRVTVKFARGLARCVKWRVMRSEKRYVPVLAVVCLGSLAGAVHAEDAWRKTMAVAPFPNVDGLDATAVAQRRAPPAIAEGTDLKREFGSRRSTRGAPAQMDNPYDGAAVNVSLPPATGRGFDRRADATDSDARWSNPYAVARIADGDERWSNPYAVARNTDGDERWANPYVAVKNIGNDERWSNPYAPSVHR
jgi:hypothetical protein